MILKNTITSKEATKLLENHFTKELFNIAARYCAPFFWEELSSNTQKLKNGTIFFLDCGNGTFAVTADHVYQDYLDAKLTDSIISCQIGNAAFIPENRLIIVIDH